MPSTFYKSRSCRQRAMLLPPRIDDDIAADNAARAIEAYVDSLDLIKLGFRHAERVIGAGQPPFVAA